MLIAPLPHRWRIPPAAIVISALSFAIACHDATPPTNPNVRPADAAFARGHNEANKAAVCHAAGRVDEPTFVEISVAGGAVAAHLGGHEGDYLATPRTPCPPPPTTGPNVRVCADVISELLSGRFYTFDVNGELVSTRTGACVDRTFPVGTSVTITEHVPTGSQVESITITPPSAGTAVVGAATATVVAGIDLAEVLFTNDAVLGQLTLCQQVEPAGLRGVLYPFLVEVFGPTGTSHPGLTVFVTPTSEAPPGQCESAGGLPLGTRVLITQQTDLGQPWILGKTVGITVEPADRLEPGSVDLFNRRVRATIGEGTTQVRFVNSQPLGQLRICAMSPPGFTGSTRFEVFALWGGADPVSVDVAANGCAFYVDQVLRVPGVLPNTFVWIREIVPTGQQVVAITVDPGHRLEGTPELPLGRVDVRTGLDLTTVTFQNAFTSP